MLESIDLELLKWGYNRQSVGTEDDKIDIPTLLQKIKDGVYMIKKFDYDIESFNLATDSFKCDNLFEFLVHYKLTENAELKYPIVINNQGQVIDGRHRICKAILKGDKTIKAIQILDSIVI